MLKQQIIPIFNIFSAVNINFFTNIHKLKKKGHAGPRAILKSVRATLILSQFVNMGVLVKSIQVMVTDDYSYTSLESLIFTVLYSLRKI